MSATEFDEALPAESELIERKRGLNRTALQEAVVAFSNANGGVILIGVDDGGTIVGRELSPNLLDEIHRSIGEARDPGRYSVHALDVGGKPVVVVAVPRRVEGFSQTSSGRVLLRRGTMKVALFGGELTHFINTRTLHRFEETEAGVALDAADAETPVRAGGGVWLVARCPRTARRARTRASQRTGSVDGRGGVVPARRPGRAPW